MQGIDLGTDRLHVSLRAHSVNLADAGLPELGLVNDGEGVV